MTHVRAAVWQPGPAGNLAGREAVCTGLLAYVGHRAVQADIANFKIAWAKFEALVDGARLATRQLRGR